jgi:hypothetical protein
MMDAVSATICNGGRAIGSHERQLFGELLWRMVSSMIFFLLAFDS